MYNIKFNAMNTKILNGFLFIFIIILNLSVFSQKKTDAMLFGDVKCNGEHVPYVNIIVKGTNIGTMTDGTGHYKLANLPLGKNTIVVQAMGYKPQEKEVEMKADKETILYINLEEDALKLNQAVVTGTRTEHYIKDTPVRTEVITSREIELKNAFDIYEVLEGTPGIRVEQQCQFCNFSMVRMQGLGAEHTQILINGQPIYSGLASIYGLQQIGTADIDRVEIVKGAGSALYGSSAVAGAINIISKEPSFVPSTKVGIQFGNYNTNKYNISSSIRNEKGNLGLNVYAQKLTGNPIDQTQDGNNIKEVKHKDGISDRVATNLNNAGFSLYANDLLSKKDKLIIRGRYLYEKRQGGIMDDDYYKNPLTDGTESIVTDRYETELSYNNKFKNNSEINFLLAYTNHNRDATNDSYLSDYMATHNDSTPDVRDMRPYLADENSITATLTYGKKIKEHQLLTGIQGFYNKLTESGMYVVVDSASQYTGTSYKSTSNKSAREFGVFIQDEWALNDRLTIVPGIRYDIHNSEEEYKANKEVFANSFFPKNEFNENSFSPRFAIKYDISKKITLRANAGTGFRAPYGFSEDLHLCSGSPRVWKSSDLKPETSVSYNLSADYYGKKIRISTNIFRTDLKDKIAFTDAEYNVANLGYDYQWKNIDNAFVQGIEISILANVVKNTRLGFDYTINQGKYEHERDDWKGTKYNDISKYISRFPSNTGNLKLEYSPKTWDFSLSGNYTGKMYIDYFAEDESQSKIKHTDGFAIFNAKISKRFNMFKIYAGVNNIFNYLQPEKHTDDAAFMYAPVYGTMYYAGLTINILR